MYDISKSRNEASQEIEKMMENFENWNFDKSPLYAQITQIEFHDGRFYISGDLFTNSLKDFDSAYFNDNYEVHDIKPIILGFETRISLRSVSNKCNPVTELINTILVESEHNITFNKYDNREATKALITIQNNNELEELLSTPERNLFNTIFTIKYQDIFHYNATFFCSASPFKLYYKKIIFESIKVDMSVCDASLSRLQELRNTDITDDLLNFKPCILREYNVGQGNFSELIDENKNKKIVFDPGMTYLDDHDNFLGSRKELETLNAECFFISHFDLDHILGIIYLNDFQFTKDKLWIIPKPEKINVSQNAKRLIWYLHNTSKLRYIEDSNLANVFHFNTNITIYKGTAPFKGKKDSVYTNCSGIMISVNGITKSALLTGDCLYNYWSSKILGPSGSIKYDYLIVPHHGCNIKQLASIKILGNQDATAIVPVGIKQKHYHHPNFDHIDRVSKNGFKKIYFTVDLRSMIILSSVNIDLKNNSIILNSAINKSPKDYIELQLN